MLISLSLLVVGLIRARKDPEQAAIAAKILARGTTLLPGALVVYLSFNDGGFFPGPPAQAAVLLALLLAARLLLGVEMASRASGARLRTGLIAVFAAYAGWVLASGAWSGAVERALSALDYVLVYGLAFVLLATCVKRPQDFRWVMRGLALGSFVVCASSLLSRVLPTVLSIPASLDTPRLSYPLTYWNALGLLAAVGFVLCVGLTCDDREPRVVKTLSAMALPVLGVTLLLTFSRGPIFAGGVGLAAYVLIGRPRCLLSAAVALGPTTAIAVIAAYRATWLAQSLNGSAIQAAQGHHVARVVALCALAAGVGRLIGTGVDPYLLRLGQGRTPVPRNVAQGAWAATGAVVIVAALALGLPGAVATEYHNFIQGDVLPGAPQLRDRLTSVGADGRVTLWKIALHQFDGAPVAGGGAGTYAVVYAAQRPNPAQVVNAHSLYFENLGELGVVGLGLVVCFVLGSLLAIGRRIRRPERTLYAAAFAAVLVWAIHAGFDWDWQMPAVTLPAFVLAGASLGRSEPAGTRRSRPLLAVVVLLAAIAPALVLVSQHHLDAGLAAFGQHDCAAATSEAERSQTPIDFRSSPHEILAYCHAARGERAAAAAEMTTAVNDDPDNWEPRYGLAVVMAAAGRDPRPALLAAAARNHYEPVIATLRAAFGRDRRSSWATDAKVAPLPVDGRYGTAIAVLSAPATGQRRPLPDGAHPKPLGVMDGVLAPEGGAPGILLGGGDANQHR